MSYRLLIAEDDRDMASLLAEIATEAGFAPCIAHTGQQAVEALRDSLPDVLLTDLRLPAPGGLELLRLAREMDSGMQVVMITGYATVNDAVEGFKAGLHDLVTKPFHTDQVLALLTRLKEYLHHRRRSEQLSAQLERLESVPREPVMHSRAARQCMELVQQVAPLDVPVLLQGESGTGKGVMARHIHETSARKGSPFFALNCAAVAETLVENELFGHEKGAYTGATERKRGLLELANGGTLLLDEINSTSLEVQAKLLHFMQERSLLRIGGERAVNVDVRLLVASNEDLASLVEQGRFRRDLYYRLNVFPVELPPLRERREDIVPLAEGFLADYAVRYGSPARSFSMEALSRLGSYDWPGNIRELENIVQRAVILARDREVGVAQLPRELSASGPSTPAAGLPLSADASLVEVERYWIDHILERCDGNKTEAARRLGIDVSTLHRKLRTEK
ncbi:MAG: sigma-54 dependent transcriptional regulator [Xanthomonadaceae bacterium]|nr:sigma-54 dependent transcriptional regulator [Xanthomonadaceae bacterium]